MTREFLFGADLWVIFSQLTGRELCNKTDIHVFFLKLWQQTRFYKTAAAEMANICFLFCSNTNQRWSLMFFLSIDSTDLLEMLYSSFCLWSSQPVRRKFLVVRCFVAGSSRRVGFLYRYVKDSSSGSSGATSSFKSDCTPGNRHRTLCNEKQLGLPLLISGSSWITFWHTRTRRSAHVKCTYKKANVDALMHAVIRW